MNQYQNHTEVRVITDTIQKKITLVQPKHQK